MDFCTGSDRKCGGAENPAGMDSALVGFVHMFNPEQILIGGGVSAQEDLFIAPVRSYVMKHVMPNFAKDLEICAAALKNEAGMVGAVYYCIQQERECDC